MQAGATPVGTTLEGGGYFVNLPFYSMDLWNRQYTYKDSSSVPWESFTNGGIYESPYHAQLPGSYDAHVLMDAADPQDAQVGLFNGMSFAPIHYNAASPHYQATFSFLELTGPADPADLCLRVRAVDAQGNRGPWVQSNCPADRCPPTPDPGCRSAAPGKSRLAWRDVSGVPSKRKLKWKVSRGAAASIEEFLAPASNAATRISACLYDEGAPGAPLAEASVAGGGDCGGKPCWKTAGATGLRFKDRSGGQDGVLGWKIKAGAAGKTLVQVDARGSNAPEIALPISGPLVAQVFADNGETRICHESRFEILQRNGSGKLNAK